MRIHDLTLSAGGIERRSLVRVPDGPARAGSRPLLLLLHGAGATAQWTLEETAWEETTRQAGFLLAVPEALPVDPSSPPTFLKNPLLWNDGSPLALSAPRRVDDVAFLDELLDELRGRFPVDERRIFVTGFSNGAGMTFRLAAERAERLTAIAPVSGYCWLADPKPLRPVSTLYLVGRQDPLVPLAGGAVSTLWGWVEDRPPLGEMLDRWRQALGCGEPRVVSNEEGIEKVRYAPGPGGIRFLACLVEGLGHHWPGGRGLLSRRLFGPPSARVQANEMIREFFRQGEPEASASGWHVPTGG